MDSHYIDPTVEDSHQSRSRPLRSASRTEPLNIKSIIASPESGGGTHTEGPTTTSASTPSPTSTPTPTPAPTSTSTATPNSTPTPTPTPSFLDPRLHPDSTFTSSPTSEHFPSFPRFSQRDIDEHWSSAHPRSSTTPLVRLDPAEHLPSDRPSHLHPTSRSNSHPVNMSTVGVHQYDSQFEPGVRQSYTWPNFEMHDHNYLVQQMSPAMGMSTIEGEDSKFMPMESRSTSSSPPRGSHTPEGRELRRQRDYARREVKDRMRRERSTSHPYSQSPRESPELMSKSLSSDYPGTLAPSPLLSQSSQGSPNLSNISNISSPAYLAPYTPQLDGGDMYGGVFPMVQNEYSGAPAYSMPIGYGTSALESNMHTYLPRPHSLSASSMDQPSVHMMQSIYHGQTPSKIGMPDSSDNVRVLHSRPKPQCWEHGCNGRQFSTFSNLLRHQREKSGAATKSTCPNCGAEFTRTTARNGHIAHEKCKQRKATPTPPPA